MPEDPGVHQVKRRLFVERGGLKRRMGGGRSRTRFSQKLWDLEKIVVLFGEVKRKQIGRRVCWVERIWKISEVERGAIPCRWIEKRSKSSRQT